VNFIPHTRFLVTGETAREETSSELEINEERVEVDAKQHLN
jgi:hypothetical protein